ncbi:uncharacterized protein LOC130401501 [Gadus chalcogrammus]|uniref:uncharacterized protein LOC130401501 n=1 Tax=Gadus chalcogrammus TaxID=1042646 RepID=UPI0024C4DB63|nr:uncharacterized protein LOC130401501 [Gadus chalcogrammus]
MAGRKTSQRTSSNFEISDSDDENEEISKVIRNLDAKLQEKESREPALQWRKRDQFGRLIGKSHGSSKMYSSTRQAQSSNIGEEHVEDGTGPLTSELQETHNMIDLHIQELQQMLDAVGEDVAGGSTEASSSSSQTWSSIPTTTKYMKKARRTDMITLHARGWNMGKVKVLHRYLAKRYVKSKQRAVAVGEELQNLLTTMQTTQVEMKQWVKEVEEWAASSPKSTNCQDQQGLQRVMEGLVLKIKQRKAELYRDIDRRPKRDLIAKEKHKLEESIASYNSLVPDTAAVDTADAILSQEFPIWPWDSASTIPLETKKVVFDKTMLLSRLQEEDGILIKEMRNHCRYLTGSSKAVKREIHQIEEDLSKHSSPPPNMSLQAYEGLKCLLQQNSRG